MKISSYDIGLSSMVTNANPLNWSRESQKLAVKIVGLTAVALVALTALEKLPTAMAAGYQYVYDCTLSAEGNAVKASAEVFYNTYDYLKAAEAGKYMYKIGQDIDAKFTGKFLTAVCQQFVNLAPYKY